MITISEFEKHFNDAPQLQICGALRHLPSKTVAAAMCCEKSSSADNCPKVAVRAFFEFLEMGAVDAWTLFASLDADGDHVISLNDFVERCTQLLGWR